MTTKEEKLSGILIAIDFEKAFDSLEWNYILHCLKMYNFGPSLIRWFDALYCNIECTVISNGLTTGYFTIERGIRQGDPLPPALFILALEIFLFSIRSDPDVEGIQLVKDIDVKGVAFADDLTCFLRNMDSTSKVLTLLNDFERLSGLKTNWGKTECMWLGHSTVTLLEE
ncbi:uncharacterized protein LOC144358040 [Saccoglossus kowalevskii]